MKKRIAAVLLILAMVFSLCSNGLGLLDWSTADAATEEATQTHYAYLQFFDGSYDDYTYFGVDKNNAYTGAFTAITGLGDDYSMTWNVGDALAEGVSWLFIEVADAYDYFTEMGWTIGNVRVLVDNGDVPVNQDYIWTYANIGIKDCANNFVAEIYNYSGYSGAGYGSAIDISGFSANTNITVTFSVMEARPDVDFDVWLRFGGKYTTTIGNVEYTADVSNYYAVDTWYDTHFGEVKTADIDDGAGRYTLSWEIGDFGYYMNVDADGNPQGDYNYDPITGEYVAVSGGTGWFSYWHDTETYKISELTHFYIEIDDAYQTFVQRGYMIENVAVTINGTYSENGVEGGTEVEVEQDYLWTYPSAVAGEENDYIIELYNVDGNSGYYGTSAIDISKFKNVKNVEVSFTVKRISGNVWLQYANEATVYDAKDGTADYYYNGVPAVGNYHRLTDGSPVEFKGLGIYTLYWNVGDWGLLYDETSDWYELDQSGYYSVSDVGWLYVEIDEVYDLFTEYGYVVENVVLYLDNYQIDVDQDNIWTYASIVDGEENDYIVELYNLNGYSEFYGKYAIDPNEFGDGSSAVFNRESLPESVDKIAISFMVKQGDSIGGTDMSVHTGKWVAEDSSEEEFDYDLLLEGWVSGVTQEITVPSDVVLVLDQSASMYTPVGLTNYLWNWSLFTGDADGLERYTVEEVQSMLSASTVAADTKLTFSQSLSQLGYFIAQSKTGSADYCNITEHVHDSSCGLCGLEEHTHTDACGTCAAENTATTIYTWTSANPYFNWVNSGTEGVHVRLKPTTPNYSVAAGYSGACFFEILEISGENVVPGEDVFSTNMYTDDTDAEGEQHWCFYLTVSGYNKAHPVHSLQVGDIICVDYDNAVWGSVGEDGGSVVIEASSLGMSYEVSVNDYGQTGHWYNGTQYEYSVDDGVRLVDCTYASGYWSGNEAYTVWTKNDGATKMEAYVTLDYGDQAVRSDTYILHGLKCPTSGIGAPDKLTIQVSDDGTVWTDVGNTDEFCIFEEEKVTVSGTETILYPFTMTVRTDVVQEARYIRFAIATYGSYIFADEVTVDLTNRVNTLDVAGYEVTLGEGTQQYSRASDSDSERFVDDNVRLIDGVKSTGNLYSNYYYSAYIGDITIFADMGESVRTDTYVLYAVDGTSGIVAPEFKVYASNTNSKEDAVLIAASSMYGKTGKNTCVVTAAADKAVEYQYYWFEVEAHGGASFVFLDEFEIGLSSSNTFALTYQNTTGDVHTCGDDCYLCGKATHTHTLTCGYYCSETTHTHIDCELICGSAETGHVHEDGCYGCGQTYHVHDSACLHCGVVEHTHGDECEATCGYEQHIHQIDCVSGETYGCTETTHTHTDKCYSGCTAHAHSAGCGLACGETEHIHSSAGPGITSNAWGQSYCWTYDWYICQLVGDDLHMYQVTYTSTPAKDDTSRFYGQTEGQLFYEGNLEDNLEIVPVDQLGTYGYDFYFYKTQYGALYDSLNAFVQELDASGLKHRISVVGFSSELNCAQYYDGTGLYVDGVYYTYMEAMEAAPSGVTYVIMETMYEDDPEWFEENVFSSYTSEDGTGYNISDKNYKEIYTALQSDAKNGNADAIALLTRIDKAIYEYVHEEIVDADQNEQIYASAFMTMNSDAADTGMTSILKSINAVKTDYYYTNHYLGMYQAYNILNAYKDDVMSNEDIDGDGEGDRQKIVVLFTDGIAQAQRVGNSESGYAGGYQNYTNDWTIRYARQMENEFSAKVYTICTSTVRNTDDFSAEYLYYAASDFADKGIYSVAQGQEESPLEDSTEFVYFNRVESADDMAKAFLSITTELGGTTSSLDVSASLQDIMTMDFVVDQAMWAELQAANAAGSETVFASKDANGDATAYADIINEYIKVYTVDAIAADENDLSRFPEGTTGPEFLAIRSDEYAQYGIVNVNDEVMIEVGLRADGRYYVRIDGFDYSENYVSDLGRDPDGDDVSDFYGQKLVTVIPIEVAPGTEGGQGLKTNYDTNSVGSFSGILAYKVDDAGNITEVYQSGDFEEPQVDLPTTVTVSKTVVDGNENAAFGFQIDYSEFAGYDSSDPGSTTGNVLGGNWLKAVGTAATVGGADSESAVNLADGDEYVVENVVVGSEMTITELDFSEYDVSVKVYDKFGNEVTDGVTVDAGAGTVTITGVSEGMSIQFTNTSKRGDMTITKTIPDYNATYEQSFVFRVQGTDANTEDIDMTVLLKVDETGTGSVTISDLPKGSYTITENGGWSWRYTVDQVTVPGSDGTAAPVEEGKVELTSDELTVTFENKVEEERWMDGSDSCQNLLAYRPTTYVKVYQYLYYRTSKLANGTLTNDHYLTQLHINAWLGDRVNLLGDSENMYYDRSFNTNSSIYQTVSSKYFEIESIELEGINGDQDGDEFVITSFEPGVTTATITIKAYIDVYSDVEVIHEFYINSELAATDREQVERIVVASTSAQSAISQWKIVIKTSGTIESGGNTYDIADFTVDDSLIQTTGLTIKRVTMSGYTDRFAVQSYDYSTDVRQVVIRYDLTTDSEA